jgi:predicted glycosyltransferase
MLAAYFFKIPIVIFLDYEFVQTIPFVKPKMMFFPNMISKERLSKFPNKVKTYPGIKEDIYVPGFKPDDSIKKHINFKSNLITAIVRPPAYQAHYHNPESDLLFTEVMSLITELNNVQAIILPRDNQQKLKIEDTYKNQFDSGKFIIPTDVVDGLNLMWFSDLVISGGGTMNREAAALGVPVYSIFKGKIGDVDKYLSTSGRLTLIESVADVRNKIIFEKRFKPIKPENINSLAFHSIVNDLENLINEISGDIKNHSANENNEKILPFRKKHNTK